MAKAVKGEPVESQDWADVSQEIGRRARAAGRMLAAASSNTKNDAIEAMAAALRASADAILKENAADVAAAKAAGLSAAMLDRLSLTAARIEKMAASLDEIIALRDPVGEIIEGYTRPNGLQIQRLRVPLGVVLTIYESRPNVTSDVAALCLKSGNAAILRGGKESLRSNLAIHKALAEAITSQGLPADALQMIDNPDRDLLAALLREDRWIDVVIPRGGEELIRAVAEQSTIPVIKHYKGVCHVYVDELGDLDMAEAICFNAKVQRAATCNAMETMLVHKNLAARFLPRICRRLAEAGVELRGDERTRRIWPQARPATEEDWYAEYLDLVLSIRIVDDIQEAIDHIAAYSSNHTDAIISQDLNHVRQFVRDVDSSSVMVNTSTRFSDGGEYGLGAEVGISTDKLHARGPMGVRDLTTYKWVVYGDGQVRT
ncbi:MAG: glutamate-5-semialdehyde dehydrogenase [Planctomycetota bacterium]|nr:glutamate-5-semialdehyde dehydrogenase [Planctomycetota bacterium]